MTHQIIRTPEELEALDPDTHLGHWHEGSLDPVVMVHSDWINDYEIDGGGIFPLAVIATGEQVRAARKALERT